MQITVIVCTFNRSRLLREALASIADSRMPQDRAWEILVADNNSTDDTRAVVEELAGLYPGRIRYVFEQRQGKSNALNTAIANSDAEVLAFADDDVTVHPDWLESLTAPILEYGYAGAGGRVIPRWETSVPDWLEPGSWMQLGPLVQFDLGSTAAPLHETPVGTNMAFRRQMFVRYGNFRTDLGPCPGSEIRNEDSEFVRRLLQNGEVMYYLPDAIVYHPVPANRLTREYFLRWWYDKGRSDLREAQQLAPGIRWKVGGVPLYLVRRISRWSLAWLCSVDRKARFDCKVRVWLVAGEMAEARRLKRVVAQPAAMPHGPRPAAGLMDVRGTGEGSRGDV